MTIGDIIRHKRKELDLTQDELAERTGVTKATVSRWESGDIKKIKAPIAMKLAEVLDLDPILFVTGQQIIFPDEYEVVSKYRMADDGTRASVRKLLDIEGEWP